MDIVDYFGGYNRLFWAVLAAAPCAAIFAYWLIVDRKWASPDPPNPNNDIETVWAITAAFIIVPGALWLLFSATLAIRGY